jgi:small subunit ribosomal protein S17
MVKEKTENKKTEAKILVGTRGRVFKGNVIRKIQHRVLVEIDRNVFVRKYQRFYVKKTRVHARISEGLDINLGDLVLVRECRPLSKIIHHIVIKKVTGEEK